MDWSRSPVNQQTEPGDTPVRPRASPLGAAKTAAVRDLLDLPPPCTRSITDRIRGYEPRDGEFDSPRVYVKCAWCSNEAHYVGVFGNLTDFEVWDVVLCSQHVDILTRKERLNDKAPIWAPLHPNAELQQKYYADMWLTEMLYLEYDIKH